MPQFFAFSQSRGRTDTTGVWVLHHLPVDDEGFRTSWKLSLVAEDASLVEIGTLKIIKRGQLAGRTVIDSSFTALGADYGSLGAEPDFYVRLRKTAGPETATVLRALGDLATDPARRARFQAEPGFQTSLLRFTPARAALEEAAGIVATGAAPAGTEANQKLVFHTSTGGSSFTISFDLESNDEVPSRVSVVIGPNGSGKTRLLANLALAAFEPDAAGGGQPGKIEGTANFSRVLTFSYSAFDEFDLPAQSRTERAEFVRAGSGLGYRYFGLRDLTQRTDGTTVRPQLKTAGRIRNEFRDACRLALADAPDMLGEIIGRLFREPSFAATGARVDEAAPGGLEKLLYAVFRESSTGHKFVLLMTVQLVAWLRADTLVLIDEPESHLHPPLLAAFLTMLRHMLSVREAHAIIATHSPFVVQETPARYVRIVSRHVNRTTVALPSGETYGEEIGTISREVFRLNSRVGEFTEVLRTLAGRYSLDEIESQFRNGLSGQGRALVIAEQARRR